MKKRARFRALIGFVWPARNGTASDTAAAGSDGSGSVLEPVPKLESSLGCSGPQLFLFMPRGTALTALSLFLVLARCPTRSATATPPTKLWDIPDFVHFALCPSGAHFDPSAVPASCSRA